MKKYEVLDEGFCPNCSHSQGFKAGQAFKENTVITCPHCHAFILISVRHDQVRLKHPDPRILHMTDRRYVSKNHVFYDAEKFL